MRDVRDWNKYVDLLGKAVSRHPEPAHAAIQTTAPPDPPAAQDAAHHAAPPRKGRGPRKEETREELLARLLDPTLTLEETARMLEVCPTTVRRYTNKGILSHERSKGNQRRFKLSSVLAFMQSQQEGAEPAASE